MIALGLIPLLAVAFLVFLFTVGLFPRGARGATMARIVLNGFGLYFVVFLGWVVVACIESLELKRQIMFLVDRKEAPWFLPAVLGSLLLPPLLAPALFFSFRARRTGSGPIIRVNPFLLLGMLGSGLLVVADYFGDANGILRFAGAALALFTLDAASTWMVDLEIAVMADDPETALTAKQIIAEQDPVAEAVRVRNVRIVILVGLAVLWVLPGFLGPSAMPALAPYQAEPAQGLPAEQAPGP